MSELTLVALRLGLVLALWLFVVVVVLVLRNDLFGTTTTFTVSGFDKAGLAATVPAGARVYVTGVFVDGVQRDSICWLTFEDVVGGGEIVITVDGDADAAAARGCGGEGTLPDSLTTGGFPI